MSPTALRCRKITKDDLAGIVTVLTSGFSHDRDRQYWERAMDRLSHHSTPPDFPRYGYLLEHQGAVVGVILQIFAQIPGCTGVRCSMSSWFVLPHFRPYASLMVSRALRHDATYVNATPARATWPLLEAQGYTRYCNGRVLAALWLARGAAAASVVPFTNGLKLENYLSHADSEMLRQHAAYGCIPLLCEADGKHYPFVFVPRRRFGVPGVARLVFCSAEAGVPRFARAIGSYLARHGFPLVVLDADGPLPGIPGLYTNDRPKYFRGPNRPRIGDHAYSELAIFGA